LDFRELRLRSNAGTLPNGPFLIQRRTQERMNETVTIDGVTLTLGKPIANTSRWIGQPEPLRQLAACWLTVDDADLPLTPRLIGVPGVGKTALATFISALPTLAPRIYWSLPSCPAAERSLITLRR
jgi:hypothetical protein